MGASDASLWLKVGRVSTLRGAVAKAEQVVATIGGELTLSNIENKAEYEGKSAGINLGAGQNATGKFTPQGTSAGFGKDGDSASSTTLAAISGIAGNKDARTGSITVGAGLSGSGKVDGAGKIWNFLSFELS